MDFNEILIQPLQDILEGKEKYIPNPYGRMGEIFHIHKSRYIVVGSVTGLGKTSLVDDILLKSYFWLIAQTFPYHIEGLYYSMERNKRDKYGKWLSWYLFNQKVGTYPSNLFVTGVSGKRNVTEVELKLAQQYTEIMDKLLTSIHVEQGPQEVSRIREDIERLARKVGVFITSNSINVYINGKVLTTKVNGVDTPVTFNGNPYIEINYKGRVKRVRPNSNTYLLKNPNTFIFIVIDHIGKTKLGKFMIKKAAIDELDELLAEARDKYGFIPIVISQFNRDIANIQRLKYSGGDLEPLMEDFKDSGCPTESADLVASIFDPYRYKSYDSNGIYKGYNIASVTDPCTLTPDGLKQRFRSFHILKNSYGSVGSYGMRFTGEVMNFDILPLPGSKELNQIYAEIAQGK